MKRITALVILTVVTVAVPVLLLKGNLAFPSDVLHQQVAFILETKRMLATGSPWWSWNTFLGADFIGSYAFYTATSPFVWLMCLFPDAMMGCGVLAMLLLKLLCMAWLSRCYLRVMDVSDRNSTLGAFLFTFSSFTIGSLYYYHFYEPVMAFLLLMIAVERLLRGRRWGMTGVALATFVTVFVNFYFACSSLMAALIYVLLRATGSGAPPARHWLWQGMAAVAAGLVMSAAVLLPVMWQMRLTTRVSGELALDGPWLLNLVERLRTLFMPKVVEGATVWVPGGSGEYSNEAAVALFATSLLAAHIVLRRDWLSRLGIVLLVLYLSPLGGVFSLFTDVLYTRWAYFLTLTVVLATVRVIDGVDSGTMRVGRVVTVYTIVAAAVVAALAAGVLVRTGWRWPGVQFVALVALFAGGTAVTWLWAHGRLPSRWLLPAAAVATVAQVWLFLINLHGINHDVDSQRYQAYRDGIAPHPAGTVATARTDFRAPDDDFLSFNLGLLTNRPSTSGYHSIITPGIDSLFSTATRHRKGRAKLRADTLRDEFDALLGVSEIYDIGHDGRAARRPARWALPIGTAYDTFISRSEFDAMADAGTADLPLLMLAHLVVEDADVQALAGCLTHAPATALDADSVAAARCRTAAESFSGDSRGFSSTVSLPRESVMFYSVPFSDGFTAGIDGRPARIYKANLCLMALRVPAGVHTITVTYLPPALVTGLWVSTAGVLLLLLLMFVDYRSSRLS